MSRERPRSGRNAGRRTGRKSVWLWGSALVGFALLLILLVAIQPASVEARAESLGHWQQTGMDTSVRESSDTNTYSVSDGSATQDLSDPGSKDRFVSTATWNSPKSSYQAGETVELTLQVKILQYVWNGEANGYIHQGLNHAGDFAAARIDAAGMTYGSVTGGAVTLVDDKGESSFAVSVDTGTRVVSSAGGTVSAQFPAGYSDGELMAIYVESKGGAARYTYAWVAGPAAGTDTSIGQTDSTTGGNAGRGSKVPGPRHWWDWLAGTAVTGIITAGLGLTGALGGGAAGVAPTSPRPRRRNVPPPGAPRLRQDGSPAPRTVADDGYGSEILSNTAKDTAKALGHGIWDFTSGTLRTIATGYKEMGVMGYTLVTEIPSALKDLYDDPMMTIGKHELTLIYTAGNIGSDLAESVNPTEELKSLVDPNLSAADKAWAASSAALKAANALLFWDSVKKLRNSPAGAAEEPGALETPEPPPKLSVKVARNKTRCWQGTEGEKAANASGGTPVGQTPRGQATLKKVADLPYEEARPVFEEMSADYASEAEGIVDCYLENGFKPRTIFSGTELGNLLKNPKVTKINVFVWESGKWVEKNLFKPR